MKKIVFLATLLIWIVSSTTLKGDPAKKVNLTYQDGKLKIEALHKVRNANKHYIDKITVKVNGKEVKLMTLDKQSSAASQVIEIDVPDLKKDDQIEVTTRCNEFGKKSAKLKL